MIAVEDAAGLETHPIEYIDIPRATFCTPTVGSFGLTEEQAREQGIDVVVGKVQYGAVGAGTVYGDRTGVIKIIGDKKYGELVGGHIVGSKATELIQELVNAKALEGGYPEVARIIHGHPTLAEGVMEAARAADGWLIHGCRSADPAAGTLLLRPRLARRLPRRRARDARAAGGPGVDPGAAGGLAAGGVGAFRCAEEELIYREDVEARAAATSCRRSAGPTRSRPTPSGRCSAATYAKQIGRGVAFSLAAFRQAFAGGRDLGERDNVLIAAAACEMHPRALLKGAGLGSIAERPGARRPRRGRRRRARRPRGRDRRPRLPRRPRARAGRGGARREGQPRVRAERAQGGPRPGAPARAPAEADHVEVLEIATGEIALFWDTEPSQTGRLARALRADLAQLESAEFLAKWRRWQTFD